MIFVAMILLGSVIGFVGAGGAGVTITLLTVGFGVPVHTALAVALAAMTFTMISGTISHYREHEVDVKPGAIIGGSGMIGSIAGANVSNIMPPELLATMTSLMLIASGLILYVRLYQDAWLPSFSRADDGPDGPEALCLWHHYRPHRRFLVRCLRHRRSRFHSAGPDGRLRHFPAPRHRDLHDDCPAHFRRRRAELLVQRPPGPVDFRPDPAGPEYRRLYRS